MTYLISLFSKLLRHSFLRINLVECSFRKSLVMLNATFNLCKCFALIYPHHGFARQSNEGAYKISTKVLLLFSLMSNLLILEVTAELMAPGKYPGCSGTRNLHDNLADLRAQVAANQRVSC